jgi:hypothetical protein
MTDWLVAVVMLVGWGWLAAGADIVRDVSDVPGLGMALISVVSVLVSMFLAFSVASVLVS